MYLLHLPKHDPNYIIQLDSTSQSLCHLQKQCSNLISCSVGKIHQNTRWAVVVRALNPSTWEKEADRSF